MTFMQILGIILLIPGAILLVIKCRENYRTHQALSRARAEQRRLAYEAPFRARGEPVPPPLRNQRGEPMYPAPSTDVVTRSYVERGLTGFPVPVVPRTTQRQVSVREYVYLAGEQEDDDIEAVARKVRARIDHQLRGTDRVHAIFRGSVLSEVYVNGLRVPLKKEARKPRKKSKPAEYIKSKLEL